MRSLLQPRPNSRAPRLLLGVGQAPLGELLHRPVRGGAHLRRIGQPRTVALGQPPGGVHDLRALEAFGLDARDGVEVHRFARRDCAERPSAPVISVAPTIGRSSSVRLVTDSVLQSSVTQSSSQVHSLQSTVYEGLARLGASPRASRSANAWTVGLGTAVDWATGDCRSTVDCWTVDCR